MALRCTLFWSDCSGLKVSNLRSLNNPPRRKRSTRTSSFDAAFGTRSLDYSSSIEVH